MTPILNRVFRRLFLTLAKQGEYFLQLRFRSYYSFCHGIQGVLYCVEF